MQKNCAGRPNSRRQSTFTRLINYCTPQTRSRCAGSDRRSENGNAMVAVCAARGAPAGGDCTESSRAFITITLLVARPIIDLAYLIIYKRG